MKLPSLAIVAAGMLSIVSGQCQTPKIIENRQGEFQSPNFGNEYGKKANCTWRFNSKDWRKYAVRLEMKQLRLFISPSTCIPGSYNLTLNKDLMACREFARERNTFCHSYYNDETCSSQSEITNCKVSKQTGFPVEVKYESDGGTINGSNPGNAFWGFKIAYEFIECREATTTPEVTTLEVATTAPEETTLVDTTKATTTPEVTTPEVTTPEDTTTAPEETTPVDTTTVKTTTDTTTERATSTPADDETTTEPATPPASGFTFTIIVLVAVITFAVIAFAVITFIVICIRRHQKAKKSKEKTKKNPETQPTAYTGNIEMKDCENAADVEGPYTIMSGLSKSGNSIDSIKDETAELDQENPTYTAIMEHQVSRKETPLKQNDAVSSDVYSTIPKEHRVMKNGSKKHTSSVNQEPEPSCGQESTYAIMNTGFQKSQMEAQTPDLNRDENSTYAEMDKNKKQQDNYTVSTKSKHHQPSNKPEQGPTYTAINHTRSSTVQPSSVEQNSEAAGDVYAVIPNSSTENIVATPTTESQNPSLHHTPEEEDTYTVIGNSNSTVEPQNLYAAVENSSGVKKTIHYEKETKDNILYASAP